MKEQLSNKDQAIQFGINDKETVKRFKSKLMPQENGCIEFNGPKWDKRDLYRMFSIYKTKRANGQYERLAPVKAHRFAYALHHGFNKLPRGQKVSRSDANIINHICGNKKCVNIKHLNILTHGENSLPENKRPK
jgi:hypothetical protein